MAQYDGAIRIVTKITTKDAEESLASLEWKIKKSAKTMDELRSKMDTLKGQKIPTKEWKSLQDELSASEKELSDLVAKQNEWEKMGITSGGAWDSLNEEIANASDKVDSIKEKMRALVDAGKDFQLGEDTEQYKAMERQLQHEEESVASNGERYKKLLDKSKKSYKELGETARKSFEKINKSAKETVKTIVKGSIKTLGSAVKNIFTKIGGFTKKSGGLLSTLGDRFKGLALSLLIFNQISKAFNAMMSGIREGIGNLARYSTPVNAALSSMKSALTQLKNSLATAFAPILTAVAPMLTSFINMLSKAATYVGMLIAALTGQKTFTKATAVQENYAESLGDTASAAKDANKQLSSLDKLNNLSSDSAGGGGGGGGGGISPADMFETVPIGNGMLDIANKIRDMIKAEDWEGLGDYVAEGLNKALQKIYDVINWDNVGPRIMHVVEAFTRTINSLVDNIDWNLMGRTIGAGINSIAYTLNSLIEGIDWKNLGSKFAEAVTGIVREINWNNLGNFFGNRFMILWNTLYGFVTNLKYDEIGVAIGDGLNGAISSINLGTIGATIGRAITGAFQTAIAFADTFDWKALGDNISNGINMFFVEFDGKTVAEGATKLISGILDSLIEAITVIDWTEVWKDIIDFLVNVNWVELIGKIIIAASQLIYGLFEGLVQAIAETDWGTVWERVLQAFKDFFGIHSPSTAMEEQGQYLMSGLLNGIKGLLGSVKDVWNGIKDIVFGVINQISTIIASVVGAIQFLWNGAWSGMANTVSNIWNGIVGTIVSAVQTIVGWISDLFSIFNQFSGKASAVSGVAGGAMSGILPRNMSRMSTYSIYPELASWTPAPIPKLAAGAVVPPNREFMAVLGDNKRETEIVSPLSTMKQANKEAVLEVLSELGLSGGNRSNQGDLVINIDGREVFRVTQDYAKDYFRRTGLSPYPI